MCDNIRLEGCECCDGVEICCPAPCCPENAEAPRIEWGQPCGRIEWVSTEPPPSKVDIYLALYEGKPMVKIVKVDDEAAA